MVLLSTQGGDIMSEAAKATQAPPQVKQVAKPKVVEQPPVLKGSIVIQLYEMKPAVTTFKGDIKGGEVSIAMRALMRGYRRWKAEAARDKTQLQVNKKEMN